MQIEMYQDFSELKDIISPNVKILSLASLNTNSNRESTMLPLLFTGFKEKKNSYDKQLCGMEHAPWLLIHELILGFYVNWSVSSDSEMMPRSVFLCTLFCSFCMHYVFVLTTYLFLHINLYINRFENVFSIWDLRKQQHKKCQDN